VFPPKIGWRLFYWLLMSISLFGALVYTRSSHSAPSDPPRWLGIALVLAVPLVRPATLVASPGALACYSLYGLRRKLIPWSEASRVSSDWQEMKTREWTFMGYRVTVTGRDGTRIQHDIQQTRQGRFLDSLREHLPASAFDHGLYDWHP
jgi:hypothetical protein